MNLIVIDDEICDGSPTLEGTRFTVYNIILGCDEVGVHAFLEQTPEVDSTALQQVVQFCDQRLCEQHAHYCHGCSLRQKQEGITTVDEFVNQYNVVQFTDSDEVMLGAGNEGGTVMMPGTPDELETHWRGEDAWKLASAIARQFGW
jgi:uncharacterized protein (DUF433 family)